ncbi:uncharacterized protein LOC133907137 [Phragmites australis]|uniref:uncharacterized protein LOC133907137 n=1 Tax=Phragmites australis TaxID=29695 RepID=UPI002D7654C1|nr:uncharacterized protein LOC133907137 [Phragmites australis]
MSSLMLSLFVLLASSSSAVLAALDDDEHGLKSIHLCVHETFAGANATAASGVASPFGANSSFRSVGVVELRVGRNRSSQLLGRYQAIIFGTSRQMGAGYLTSIALVFTAGEYGGSTLSVQGPVPGTLFMLMHRGKYSLRC